MRLLQKNNTWKYCRFFAKKSCTS